MLPSISFSSRIPAKTGGGSSEDTLLYIGADTGFISQNIYLFCASEGLATVVRASVDRAALAKALGLRPEQRIVACAICGVPETVSCRAAMLRPKIASL